MLFLVLLVVVKLVFLRLCLSIQTLIVLFMSVAAKEEMRWQRSSTISQNLLLWIKMEKNKELCKELVLLLILLTCLSQQEKLQFIQELP